MATPPAAHSVSFNPNSTIGALEVGVFVAIFLSGVVTVQVYIYLMRYTKDPWGLKFLVRAHSFPGEPCPQKKQVLLVWCLDFGHTIAICHALYIITVTQYGKPELLIVPPASLDSVIILSGFVGPLEQGWFTYRLYKFTKTLLPLLCGLLSFIRLVGSIGLSIIALEGLPLPEYNARVAWLVAAILSVGAAVDTILVISLCYYLGSWRSTGPAMRKPLNQLMTWTIETGAITTLGATTLLITYLTMKDTFVYMGVFVILAKCMTRALYKKL
ncbi:hypothetical protein C8J57DRAFT_1524665 [Mycena rebaudengoi]|nr:hypothetical protein C8J57DRAFT_1524665 [Mycena rebaudengoi]